MKKICIFTSTHLEYDIRIFKKEIISLLKNGFFIYYHTNKENLNVAKRFIKNNNESFKHANLIVSYNKVFHEEHRIRRFIKSLFFFLYLPRDYEIYHFHDPDLLFTGLFLKILGKRVIYDVHENYRDSILDKEYLPRYLRKLLSRTISSFETCCCCFFDAIICATPSIEDRFRNSNIVKTIVINNYPFKTEFSNAKIKYPEKEECIIYAGGITKKRGMTNLINSLELVNKTHSCQLKLAGEIYPPQYETELKNLVGWRYVEYLGVLDRKTLAEELNKAKVGAVLFLPEMNHVNAQPNKIFEYMSAGIPVIASNFPLWLEIVENNKCGICVNPENPQEIAKAIIEIMSDETLSDKMGENGERLIGEKYNWENEEIKLLQCYKELDL